MYEEKIDFVILWVDGNDPNWSAEKNKYCNKTIDVNNSDVRYRDWDLLKYWFRSVEKYANWVNKVFFVTWGHVPEWLNTSNEKIRVVKHEEFIPKEFLPTFSSDVIELNLHRITDLSENFVLFNDDFFITDTVEKNFFFYNGKPVDVFIEDALMPTDDFSKVMFNNEEIINKYFNKRQVQKKYLTKIYNPKYGKYIIRNLLLAPWSRFSTFKNLHLPQAFKKSTFKKIWDLEGELLNEKCKNKFRSDENISQYLIRDWQLASGDFYCGRNNRGKYFDISYDNSKIISAIKNKKYKMICINDGEKVENFEKSKKELIDAFEKTFAEKSAFER